MEFKNKINKIREIINKRNEEIINRNPHDHEYESGAEDFEASLLGNIEYSIFNEELTSVEKCTLGETIYTLRSVLDLLETEGKNKDTRDSSHQDNVHKELKEFNIHVNRIKKIHSDEWLKDNDEEIDDYEYVEVTTTSGVVVEIKLLSFFFMCGNDIEDYLYQWSFKDETFKTNCIKEVIKFCLQN